MAYLGQMHLNIRSRVVILVSALIVSTSQHALPKNAVKEALRNAEKTFCKVMKSKSCVYNKSKLLNTKPEPRKIIPPSEPPVLHEKPPPPIPRKKPAQIEDIPPEPAIDVVSPNVKLKIILPTPTVLPPVITPPQNPPADSAQCAAALAKLNVALTTNPTYKQQGNCVIINPVQLKSYILDGQKLEFPDQPNLNCAFALQFVNFIHDSAGPIIAAQTTSHITKLYTGPGFVCRGRNGDISSKLSEHAVGNAVDIEHIQLADGRTILVKDAISPINKDYAVLNAIRSSACTYFTTVLGPGANEAHASHFHFDLGQHGKSGTYRICE